MRAKQHASAPRASASHATFSCSFIVDGGSGNGSASSDNQRYFSFSMVFDIALMSSLQTILYALSDRINRMGRTFDHIISNTSPSNLDEYVTPTDAQSLLLLCMPV
jgi:hypothetical protein